MDTASWSLPCTAESICAWAKLAVRRFKPMPSTIVSYGFRERVPSASALAYSTPRVTYTNRWHRRLTPTEGVQMYARGQTPQLALVAPWCHARETLANKQQQRAQTCNCACEVGAPYYTGWIPADPPAPPWCWGRAASRPATRPRWCRQCRRQPQMHAACLPFGLQFLILQAAMTCLVSSKACMQEGIKGLGPTPQRHAAAHRLHGGRACWPDSQIGQQRQRLASLLRGAVQCSQSDLGGKWTPAEPASPPHLPG